MADKLKYSTTQPTLSGLRTDDFVLGTGDGNYGPTSTTSYLNGFTAPEGGYVVYTLGLSNTPIGWVAVNDAALIDISRHLGNTALTIKAAKVYLAGLTDTWIFNSTPNNIVTDNLELEVNAKNLTSYPETNTDWLDISGKDNNGELLNGLKGGNTGYMDFDGTDDYVQHPPLTGLSSTSVTTEVLVKFEGALDSNDRKIFCYRKSTGSPYAAFQARKGLGNSGIYYQFNNGGTWYTSALTSLIPSGDVWYHYTFVHDGLQLRTYRNGELFQTDNFGVTIDYTGVQNFLLGYRTSSEYWKGGMSYTRVYSKALTEPEVKQNYYGGPIVTDGLIFNMDPSSLVSYENGSPQAFSLTGDYPTDLYNGLSWDSSYGGAFIPDGTDDGLITPHQPDLSLDANSLEGWVWFDQHKNYGSLLVKGPGGSGQLFNYSFFFYTGTIKYGCGDGSVWQSVGVNVSSVPTGRFHHIVGTYDLNVLKFYLNGVLQSELVTSFPPYQNTDDLQVLQIPYNLDGKVGAARIYNRALTDAEVQQNFEAQRSRFGV